MAKTVSMPEDSIIAMLRGLPQNTLVDIFSKTLIQNDTSPLTTAEKTSYQEALKKHEKGETVNWEHL